MKYLFMHIRKISLMDYAFKLKFKNIKILFVRCKKQLNRKKNDMKLTLIPIFCLGPHRKIINVLFKSLKCAFLSTVFELGFGELKISN